MSRTRSHGDESQIVTIASLWRSLVGSAAVQDALRWPPDVFALVDRALDASEAYRFVVSPPAGVEFGGVGKDAAAAATDWWDWLDGRRPEAPEALLRRWAVVNAAADVQLDELGRGDPWPVIEALLGLYAIADEACAGLGSSTTVAPGPGCRFRASARELFTETGTLSRYAPGTLRVVPRCRTSIGGISIRSLSRHVSVRGPQVEVDWHRMLSMPNEVALREEHANVLLLPWPLRVRARDFRAVEYSLPQMDPGHSGFFQFEPAEELDLALVDRVLQAASDEAGTVDAVFLPEAAIRASDVGPLEEVLGAHGVWCLIAGVREPLAGDQLGSNWVHVGVRHEMIWRHTVQHKHHRWSLDGRQIHQYHLGGALSPSMRWWEAVSIPRRSLQIIDQGAVTIAALVCEDLARLEPVADLVRSIGPSLVVTLLLDGPQLASRWTARYASVLADDPGSAVCTLTSYGMVRRCRPPGCEESRVVALWKDASGKLTEVELEDGAHAVLIATHVEVGESRTADGRRHPGTTATLTLAAVQSIRADAEVDATALIARNDFDAPAELPTLDESEISKATSWAEAIAEAVLIGPRVLNDLLADAVAEPWRSKLGIAPPSGLFVKVVKTLQQALPTTATVEDLFRSTDSLRRSQDPAAVVTGTLIRIALEQRLFAEVQAGRLPAEVLVGPETQSHPSPKSNPDPV